MFCKNLKTARCMKGYKTSEIAGLLKISQRSYLRYESGDREPNFNLLVEISDVLEVSTDYLLKGNCNENIEY